jgi:hypothetical protein
LGDTVYDDHIIHPETANLVAISAGIDTLQANGWYVTGDKVITSGMFETFNGSSAEYNGLVTYEYPGGTYSDHFSKVYREQTILYIWDNGNTNSYLNSVTGNVIYFIGLNVIGHSNNGNYTYGRYFHNADLGSNYNSYLEVYNNGSIIESGMMNDIGSQIIPTDPATNISSNNGNFIIAYIGYTSSQNAPWPVP